MAQLDSRQYLARIASLEGQFLHKRCVGCPGVGVTSMDVLDVLELG